MQFLASRSRPENSSFELGTMDLGTCLPPALASGYLFVQVSEYAVELGKGGLHILLSRYQSGPVLTGFLNFENALFPLIGTPDFQIKDLSRLCFSFTRFPVALRHINRN